MKHTDARRFYLPSADYIWPHVMNKRVRAAVTAHGGAIVGEEYFPSITRTTAARSTRSCPAAAGGLQHHGAARRGAVPAAAVRGRLHEARRPDRLPLLRGEPCEPAAGEHVEGLYSCLDYYQAVSDPFSMALLRRYDERFPGSAKFTAGSASTGLYRG